MHDAFAPAFEHGACAARQAAAGAAEPFAYALLDACPKARGRLVVACAGEEDLPEHLLTKQALRRVTKPFNLRDLQTVAREILQ